MAYGPSDDGNGVCSRMWPWQCVLAWIGIIFCCYMAAMLLCCCLCHSKYCKGTPVPRMPNALQWVEIGTSGPSAGAEIFCAALAAALIQKMMDAEDRRGAPLEDEEQRFEFTQEEYDQVVGEEAPELSDGCFIQAGDHFFKPADADEHLPDLGIAPASVAGVPVRSWVPCQPEPTAPPLEDGVTATRGIVLDVARGRERAPVSFSSRGGGHRSFES